jgi:CHAT domain-containing protein
LLLFFVGIATCLALQLPKEGNPARVFQQKNQLTEWLHYHWEAQNQLEDPSKALQYIDQILKQAWRAPHRAAEAEELVWLQLSKADYLFQLSRILESIAAYEEARRWHRQYHFPEMVEYLYKPLIAQYTRLGENEKARLLYAEALQEASGSSLAGLYNNLGLTYWNEGRNTEALVFFKKGLELKGLDAEQKGLLCLSMAHSEFELGQVATANLWLQQSLAILRVLSHQETSAKDYLEGAYALQGSMLLASKRYTDAGQALDRALILAREVYGIHHREYGKVKVEYGRLLLEQGKLEPAIHFFNQALEALLRDFHPQQLQDLPQASSLFEENTLYEALAGKAKALAALYEQHGQLIDLQQAFRCHQLAQQVELALRNSLFFESSKLNLLAYSRERMAAALDIGFALYTQTQSDTILRQAWSMIEQNKAVILLEAIQENRLQQAFNKGDTLLQQDRQLKKQIAWLETSAAQADNAQVAERLRRQADQTRDQLAGLKKRLEKRYPAYVQYKKHLSQLDFAQIKQQLLGKKQSLILEYVVGLQKSYVFGFSQQGQLRWNCIGQSDSLQREVTQLRTAMEDKTGGSPESYQQLANQLFCRLFPVAWRKTTIKQLICIPDAFLNELPFEALVSDTLLRPRWSSLAFWCKKVDVGYGYSLRVLLSQGALPKATQHRLLAIAPEFKTGQRGLAPLNNSRQEVRQIGGIRKLVCLGKRATWNDFAEKAPQYSVLHLATHASADSAHQTVGIEFFDRRVYLADIYALPLRADLVCLSACQTGLGKLQSGEGIMSLARAFAFAGSKGLVATLWSVNALATQELFGSFYAHLMEGKTKTESLSQAKRTYLTNPAVPGFQKTPYYWAALVYIGEDGVLPKEHQGGYVYLGFGGLLLAIGLYFWIWKKRTRKSW